MPAYGLALGVAAEVLRLCRRLPFAARVVADQASRAATSVALNIAEGAGEFAARDKARFYRIARRSAAELSAALDLLEASGYAEASETAPLHRRLDRVAAMLTGLAKHQLDRSEHAATAAGKSSRRPPPPSPQPQPQP